jgi:hypothetical protein
MVVAKRVWRILELKFPVELTSVGLPLRAGTQAACDDEKSKWVASGKSGRLNRRFYFKARKNDRDRMNPVASS